MVNFIVNEQCLTKRLKRLKINLFPTTPLLILCFLSPCNQGKAPKLILIEIQVAKVVKTSWRTTHQKLLNYCVAISGRYSFIPQRQTNSESFLKKTSYKADSACGRAEDEGNNVLWLSTWENVFDDHHIKNPLSTKPVQPGEALASSSCFCDELDFSIYNKLIGKCTQFT